jgi:hypothetical protein
VAVPLLNAIGMPFEPAADRPRGNRPTAQAKRQIAHEAIGRSPNVPARLNTVCMGGPSIGGAALADDRIRIPVVAIQVQSVIQGRVCSSGWVRSGDTVPFPPAIRTSLLAPGLPSSAFVAEKLRKISKFLQQVLTF